MLEPWNNRQLQPPPVHTSLCNENIDLQNLKKIFSNAIKTLTTQSPLHMESAVLSRFLYKFDKKFRNDIGYRNFKKVNTALKRYLRVNLLKDMENFMSALPNDVDEQHLYLPTRQMLEYVLIRIIAFSKLMIRITVCAKKAAIFYLDRVKRGESHWMSLLPYALLSRIWCLSLVLLQHSCNWYNNIHPYLNKLQKKGLNFLPNDYILPKDIEQWLDVRNIDDNGKLEWSQKSDIQLSNIFFSDDNNDKDFESILGYVNQINEIEEESVSKESLVVLNKKQDFSNTDDFTMKKVDVGEVISRKMFQQLANSTENIIPQHHHHIAETVTNKQSLQRFITNEEIFRNERNMKSLTGHLSFMQWQALKSSLQKLNDSLTKDRKIQKKFMKLWQEKCLDYI